MADTSPTRLTSLDGLRGIAALVVVLFHVTEIAKPVVAPAAPGLWWSVTQTPLKLVTAGTEAVLVFFVLSGLVVALPTLREGFSWAGFLTSRMLRLYLPVWAALALVVLLVTFVPRDDGVLTPDSWMVMTTVTAIDPARLLSEASLTRGSYDIVSVLWSLRWEIVFSLALPFFVLGARLVTRHPLLAAGCCAMLTVVGRITDVGALTFLPVFFLGTLMAVRLDDLRSWAGTRTPSFWRWFVAASMLLLIVNWMSRPLVAPGTPGNLALYGLAGVGAAGLVIAALGWHGFATLLDSRPAQLLGRTSFSLYLVHVPVLTTLVFALGDDLWWVAALLGVPASLGAGWVFHRFIERPSHRLARRAGRAVAHRTAAWDRVAVSPPDERPRDASRASASR